MGTSQKVPRYKDLFRTATTRPSSLRERRAGPRLFGEAVVHAEHGLVTTVRRSGCEVFDRFRAEDPVVNPPQLALLDVPLLRAGREEAGLLEHVEHVAVVDVEAVVDHFCVKSEERYQVVRERADVLLRHPPPTDRHAEGRPNFRHRDDRHSRAASLRGRVGMIVSPPLFPMKIRGRWIEDENELTESASHRDRRVPDDVPHRRDVARGTVRDELRPRGLDRGHHCNHGTVPAHRDVVRLDRWIEPVDVEREDLLNREAVPPRGLVLRNVMREVRGREDDDVFPLDRVPYDLADLNYVLEFLDADANRDERDVRREVLQERELNLDAVLVAVRDDVVHDRALHHARSKGPIAPRDAERGFP